MMTLCLDTYALMEFHDRNPRYASLLDQEWVVVDLTLTEFYGLLYRRHGEKTAAHWCGRFSPFAVSASLDLLFAAVRFRLEHRKRELSFFDCVGYAYAREHKMKFVTGDVEFKNLPGVLFVT